MQTLNELADCIAELLDLPENWDHEGAAPVSMDAAKNAFLIALQLLPAGADYCNAFPLNTGCIMLSVEKSGKVMDIEVGENSWAASGCFMDEPDEYCAGRCFPEDDFVQVDPLLLFFSVVQ